MHHFRPTTYREFADVLRRLGATVVRTKGTHEQWRLPSGRMFTLPCKAAWISERRTVLNRWCDLRRLAPELQSRVTEVA